MDYLQNGLPICLFELKSPSREQTDASEAYTQIRNYMQEILSIFIYNCVCVMSDQLTILYSGVPAASGGRATPGSAIATVSSLRCGGRLRRLAYP